MAKLTSSTAIDTRRPLLSAGNLVRVVIGFALLAALYYFRLIDLAALRAVLSRPGLLALAILACLANIPLEAVRWHILLRAQGLSPRLGQTIRIVAISVFFANFLPGAAGGDLVRGLYIYQVAQGRRTPALLSIFIDRLIGLVAFVLVGVVAILVRPGKTNGTLELSILVFTTLFVAGLAMLFFFGQPISVLLHRLFAGRQDNLAKIVADMGVALHQYLRDGRRVGLCLLVSLVIVALAIGPVILIAGAMQLGGLSALDAAIAGMYATIANSLPFTPGGLGIGESAFASACVMLEPNAPHAAYGTIFLAFRCVFIISTLPGMLAYLFYPQRMYRAAPDRSG
jgi:uncharacterized protein (TIRG00374 family)